MNRGCVPFVTTEITEAALMRDFTTRGPIRTLRGHGDHFKDGWIGYLVQFSSNTASLQLRKGDASRDEVGAFRPMPFSGLRGLCADKQDDERVQDFLLRGNEEFKSLRLQEEGPDGVHFFQL